MRADVRKLLIKLFILGIPVYIMSIFIRLFPMYYMPVEYSMWQEEKDYISAPAEDGEPDIIVIGDSRAKSGIIPEELGLGTDHRIYNIAIGGCNAIEMYFSLERYLKNHPAPGEAIVIFAPYHFCDIDNWGQTQSFNYLSTAQLLKVYVDALGLRETGVLGEHFFSDTLSCKLRLPNKYLSSVYEAGGLGRYGENTEKYRSVREDLGYTEFGNEPGNDKESYETHHPGFDSLRLVVLYYERLLKTARDNGVAVTIVQAPVNETSDRLISDEFRQGYAQMLSDIEKRYPDLKVEKEIPCYENRYFGDNNHLNRAGARRFTADVRERYLGGGQ